MNRVVMHAENLSDLIEKSWLLTSGRARHTVSSAKDALKVLITGIGQNCLKTPLLSHIIRANVQVNQWLARERRTMQGHAHRVFRSVTGDDDPTGCEARADMRDPASPYAHRTSRRKTY
jgi:hypothetical protein